MILEILKACRIPKLIAVGCFFLVSLIAKAGTEASTEKSTPRSSDQIEGVVVQPKERVDQINRYRKKLRERAALPESAHPDESYADYLNRMEEQRRQHEVIEIKCDICTLRCKIVRDAGQTSCTGSGLVKEAGACENQADQFMKSCLEQCEFC